MAPTLVLDGSAADALVRIVFDRVGFIERSVSLGYAVAAANLANLIDEGSIIDSNGVLAIEPLLRRSRYAASLQGAKEEILAGQTIAWTQIYWRRYVDVEVACRNEMRRLRQGGHVRRVRLLPRRRYSPTVPPLQLTTLATNCADILLNAIVDIALFSGSAESLSEQQLLNCWDEPRARSLRALLAGLELARAGSGRGLGTGVPGFGTPGFNGATS